MSLINQLAVPFVVAGDESHERGGRQDQGLELPDTLGFSAKSSHGSGFF
jgi:hypothetical protein